MAVYFVQAGLSGDVKIGSANNPLARIRQLQTSLPTRLRFLRVFEGGREEERALHQRFNALHKAGEWFAFSPEMISGDFGLKELPKPIVGRSYHRMKEDTAHARRFNLLSDLFHEIGGPIALAKAIGAPPWIVRDAYAPNIHHFSALICLARQAGVFITLRELLSLHEAAEAEAAVKTTILSTEELNAKNERDWLRNNPPSSMWWTPFNKFVPASVNEEAEPEPAA